MIAKVLLLCAAVAVAHAGVVGYGGGLAGGYVGGGYATGPQGGVSRSSRKQDDFGNYQFNYDIVNGAGASNGRWESGDGHANKVGSYYIHDIDGRARRLDYVADGHGFRAAIRTNEPGTAHSLAAAASYASPYNGPIAQAVGGVSVAHAAAPVAVAAAPVAVGVGHGVGLGGIGLGGVGLGYGGVGLGGIGLGLGKGIGLGFGGIH